MHPFCYQCIINYKGSTLCRGRENIGFLSKNSFSIWQEVWTLHKKYFGIRQQDEQRWQQLDRECEKLHDQYKDAPQQKFVESLLLSVVSELEERSKDGKN